MAYSKVTLPVANLIFKNAGLKFAFNALGYYEVYRTSDLTDGERRVKDGWLLIGKDPRLTTLVHRVSFQINLNHINALPEIE